MSKKQAIIIIFSLLIVLALSACSLSLAEDVLPPPGYQPPVYEEPEMLTGAAPVVAPNPENGRLIYAQKCEACHGITGLGDGSDSTALPNEVARIGAANVANLSAPLEWYSITLQGNIERFMPPFDASLSPADVWDVLSYVYTFSAGPNQVAQGSEVFAGTCAACHGEDGSGSGMPGAANFLDAERMVLLSLEDVIDKAATGNGNEGHVFSNQLDAGEIEAVALYVRSLIFPLEGEVVEEVAATEPEEEPAEDAEVEEDQVDEVEPLEEPIVEVEDALGTVTGLVTNGSGSDLPEGLEVQLEVYQSFDLIFTETVPVNADGTYQFEDVLFDPEMIYITVIETDGAFFPSAFHTGEQTVGDTIDLPITYYDATTDTADLVVSRLHAFFQFTQQGTVQIIHQVSVSNRGSKMVASERDSEPVLNFTLPEGASNLIFQSGMINNPFIETADGFADPTPIMPGESSYEILFAYELPFDRSLDWQIPIEMATDVAVIFIEGDVIKVDSEILQPSGVETLDQGVFQVMIANNLTAGDIVDIQLSTPIFDNSGTSDLTQNRWFTIALGVVGLALAGFGAWRFFAPGQEEVLEDEIDQDSLLDAIVVLDEKFEAGALEEDEYQEKRDILKSELRNLLDEEDAA